MKKSDSVIIDFDYAGEFWRSCGFDESSIGIITEIEKSDTEPRVHVTWNNDNRSRSREKDLKPYEDKNASLPNKMFKRRTHG